MYNTIMSIEILPAPAVVMPSSPKKISRGDDVSTVIEGDIEVLHMGLQCIYNKFNDPHLSVDSVCKLALTTTKLIETRRKALLLPYGIETPKGEDSPETFTLPRE